LTGTSGSMHLRNSENTCSFEICCGFTIQIVITCFLNFILFFNL
jgi:hypothetical protein